MERINKHIFWLALALLCLLGACREEETIFLPEHVPVARPEYSDIEGFFLLCEGNMGWNKATLDYYDYAAGEYIRNIFSYANPNVPKEMGDVGNDIGIYGSNLFCVINCSNKVDVLDKYTCRKKYQIDIPNCRYIRFHEGFAYVTSYAGPVQINPNYEQRGYVAKIDTVTMQIVDTCLVGFQPDELEIVGGKIYVANSGGYMVPNYENTLSVIDVATFKEERRIPIAINLHRVRGDSHGMLWVASRGDYYTTPSKIYAYDTRKNQLVDSIDCRVSNMWLDGDSLYVVSTQWSYVSMSNEFSYAIINTQSRMKVCDNFITDGSDREIVIPYAVAVNPLTKDIYVTDAKNYVTPGTLYCFSPQGVKRWSVRTGDIPAHITFLYQ